MGNWAPERPGIWAPTLVRWPDVARNVLLYVPFGVFGVLAMRDTYPRHWLRLVLRLMAMAVIFSGANEALQLYTSDRVASVTDVIAAAVGTCLGSVAISTLWQKSDGGNRVGRAEHQHP